MACFEHQIDEALEVLADEGLYMTPQQNYVDISVIRMMFCQTLVLMLCAINITLSHENGLKAIGQELSVIGLALNDLDGKDIHLLTILSYSEHEAFEAFDPYTAIDSAKPIIQSIPPLRYPLIMSVCVSKNHRASYACPKLCFLDLEMGMYGDKTSRMG